MRRPAVAAAVLCLAVAVAQPASAAWQTSKAGTATAKAGALADVTGVTCTAAGAISWTAVAGATAYRVWWSNNQGANNFEGPVKVTTGTSHTVGATGVQRARVQALAGANWTSAVVQKSC